MTNYVLREGRSVQADEACLAWMSGDIDRMVAALAIRTNPVDRHFLLQSIVALAFKQRRTPQYRALCRKVGEIHAREFPKLAAHLKADMGGTMPRVTTFPQLATILTEDTDYDRAIKVCEFAIGYGLDDGTTSGYPGRIARIEKAKIRAGKRVQNSNVT